jgi:hypothetical protein
MNYRSITASIRTVFSAYHHDSQIQFFASLRQVLSAFGDATRMAWHAASYDGVNRRDMWPV